MICLRSLSLLFLAAALPAVAAPELEEVAAFPQQQVTGVGVTKVGRVFVNFPYWTKDHTVSVAEVERGGPRKAYPNAEWNSKEGAPQRRWVCVQSVVVDSLGDLWVLDPASPLMEGVVPGGAKLVKIDLATDEVTQTILFDETTAPKKSYLNDVRIDTAHKYAYMTESGIGSLVVADLQTGRARRLLKGDKSTLAEPNTRIVVDTIEPIDPTTEQTPAFHADGIALDAEGGWLYYHALTAHALYRIKTEHLRNEALNDADLAAKVEKVRDTPLPDGMLEGPGGSVYLTDFENNSILRFDPKGNKLTTVIKDARLQWPDTLSWGAEGWLYVTTSQIHRQPKYNGGVSKQQGPFRVYRLKVSGME